MEKYFKLFELPDGSQVLVESGYDNEDYETPYKIYLTTYYGGIRAQIGACYKTEEQQEIEFNEYTLDKATQFRQSIITSLTSQD